MKLISTLVLIALTNFLPVSAQTSYALKEDIPIGTTLITGEDGTLKGKAPSGELVNIQLDEYDRWWLAKPDSEMSKWLDIYHTSVSTGNLQQGVTFVQFMKVVMFKGLTLKEFNQ